MSETIYKILTKVGGSDLEGLVWVVVIAVLALGMLGIWKRYRHAVPGLMISVGIFGTFCGIFLALQNLNFTSVEEMTKRVPDLINGMKTAFVTSLIGMFGAIVFRILTPAISYFLGSRKKEISLEQRETWSRLEAIREAITGDNEASVSTQLQKTRADAAERFDKFDTELSAIKNSIAGDGEETTLVTQMQMLRNATRDGFKELSKLEETIRESLASNLASLVTEIQNELIPTLEKSFTDLKEKIEEALIEQFGQTFKEFNASTQAIKQWQEEHKTQVEQVTSAFNQAATGITTIRENCEAIPMTMESLRTTVGLVQQEASTLHAQLNTFAAIRKQAEEAFPLIKKNFSEIEKSLSDSATGFNGLKDTIQRTFQEASAQSQRSTEEYAKRVKEMADTMQDSLRKAQRESAQETERIMAAATRKLREEMDKELERVARAWGGNLVSIAEKCDEAIQRVGKEERP